ncbi:hypothetical protein [Nostoc sp.]
MNLLPTLERNATPSPTASIDGICDFEQMSWRLQNIVAVESLLLKI